MLKIFYILLGLILTSNVFAVGGVIQKPDYTVDVTGNVSTLIAKIITYSIGIAGILGVIGITWGGIQMVLSTGEDEKMKKARYIVIYSIVGVILAGVAYTVVNTIGKFSI